MELREQFYTNRRRIYYHGTKEHELDIDNARWPWLFITSNLYYAITYCKIKYLDYGWVFLYNLAEKLNIWNGQSRIDFEKVKKLNYLTKGDLDILRRGLDLIKTSFDRTKFVDDLQEMGYDGFFNFEYTSRFDKQPTKEYNALGIFNSDKLIKRGEYTFEDLMIKSEKFYQKIEQQYNTCVRECNENDLLGKDKQKDMSLVYGFSERFTLLPVSEIKYILSNEKPRAKELIKENKRPWSNPIIEQELKNNRYPEINYEETVNLN